MQHDTPSTGAEQVHWNLDDLCTSPEDASNMMASAVKAAKSFSDMYRGAVADLDAAGLAGLLEALEQIHDASGRAYTYAYLHWVTATADASRGALLQSLKESYAALSQLIVFFDVEFAALSDEAADTLINDKQLDAYRHHLEIQRLNRTHLLSEAEEKILSETSVNGRQAWNRFFDETISSMSFELHGKTLSEQEILAKLHDPDRSVRRDAALSFTEGLDASARVLTFVTNTLAADKASTDRLRQYDSWIASRNLSNEISEESVNALVDSVVGRYDIPRRFYALKRSLLGYDEMYDYDRYAPVGESNRRYSWAEGRTIVLDAYNAFAPEMGEIARRFFDDAWIDAAVVSGKRGGAFSHGAVPSVHPYVMMNYTGRSRDVQTLAHELGHGVHQYLSRERGIFHADTPLTTAETASVFGEMLVFNSLVSKESDDRNRLAMLVGKIDDSMATVFRQVTMNRFEDRVHTHRREKGELTTEELCVHWIETQSAMFGDTVTLGDHYRLWWSYIPHFLHTPGYVYAYAFGELLVMALYGKYRDAPVGFAQRYMDLLAAGGSDWPHELLAPFGIDLRDPAFWNVGLEAIDSLVSEAEELAARYARINES